MQFTSLGKETQGGGSPTLYATDRDTYLVQGWRVQGQGSTQIEIPESLSRHLPLGYGLATTLHATGHQWHGDSGISDTYTLSGAAVTDPDVLDRLGVPEHEWCVEVGQRRECR